MVGSDALKHSESIFFLQEIHFRNPHCGVMILVPSLECWKEGSIPSSAQWVKDPASPQHCHRGRSQLWLGFDPWQGTPYTVGVAKKEKEREIYVIDEKKSKNLKMRKISFQKN